MTSPKEIEDQSVLNDGASLHTMRSARGYISGNYLGRFEATFLIDGLKYNFSGSFTSSVPPFECHNAVLQYNHTYELTSTRSFYGTIGPWNVRLNVRNGPSISGPLNMRIDPGSSISDSGVWTQN